MGKSHALKHHQQRRQQQPQQNPNKTSRMFGMLAISMVIINITIMMMMIPDVSARYLPTRSNNDQLRRQEIKEILRLLLDMPTNSDSDMASSMAFRDQQSPMFGWPNQRDRDVVGAAYDLIRGPRNIAAAGGVSSSAVADPNGMVAPSNQRAKRSNLLT